MGALNRAYIEGDGHGHSASHAECFAQGQICRYIKRSNFLGGNLDGHDFLCLYSILIFEAGFALDVHTFKKSVLNAFYLAGRVLSRNRFDGFDLYGMIVTGGPGGVLEDWNVDSGLLSFWYLSHWGGGQCHRPGRCGGLLKELGASKSLVP